LGIVVAVGFIIAFGMFFVSPPAPDIFISATSSFNKALWEFRSLDILGQMLIILAGTFAILTLVKERTK
jgi:multisubunit Na+/H+ antiporter MnhB subunit